MHALEDRLRAVARSHGATLGEHAGATIEAGGKRLRPLLVFVAAGPAAADDAALRAAVAVELVHSATLVHDDVLDAAVLRRGRPTVVAAAGRGDRHGDRRPAVLARVRRARGRRDAPSRCGLLSDASSALVQGELLQREDAWNLHVARERYLRRCDLKTARLFDAACRLGALAGGGERRAAGRASARASGSRSSCSTTCSTCQGRRSGPASIAAPTCSTAR